MSLTVFFTVIAATTLSIEFVQCKSVQGVDVQSILQSLQQQLQKEQSQQVQNQVVRLDDDDDDDDDDVENNRYGSLKSHEVEELIRIAANDKDEKKRDRYRIRDDDDDDRKNQWEEQLLGQLELLQEKQERDNRKPQHRVKTRVKKQYIQPSNLLSALYDDRDDEPSDLNTNSYSNIYLVLNPDAVEKSRNKDKLNDLLSSILAPSLSRNKKDRKERRKERFYKGFVVKDSDALARRLNRESNEIYAPRNSMEREYKPKRSRGERGGGGSGRTAIPYIRHRGDIYERDN